MVQTKQMSHIQDFNILNNNVFSKNENWKKEHSHIVSHAVFAVFIGNDQFTSDHIVHL